MQIEADLPPGARDAPAWAAAVFDRDAIVRAWLWGRPDLREPGGVTLATPFRWFSVTKLVTATAVLASVERGLIALDDPIDRYLPWFQPEPPATVTIEQLLSHSAGLADPVPLGWVRPPGAALRPPSELTRSLFARHRRLHPAPGTSGPYTNLGYLVLGELLSTIGGCGYDAQAQALVLGPAAIGADFVARGACGHERVASWRALGMALAFLPRTPRLVAYVRDGFVGLRPFELEGQAYGGLVGSLDDLVRLGRLFLREGELDGVRVLAPELTREMWRRRGAFGLGFWIYMGGWIGHAGWAGGFRSELRIHPRRGIGVAVLANGGVASALDVAAAIATVMGSRAP